MRTKLTLDKAGRVVLPKPLRDELELSPGDTLEIESRGEQIMLRPVRGTTPLQKERGIWVYQYGVFVRYAKNQVCCGAHSLAEVYAALTRMPGPHRISREQAMLLLSNIRERLTIVSLDDQEYFQTIAGAAATEVVGGTIYDALLVSCALKAKAEIIYTWNVKHYGQFGLEATKRVRQP